MKQAIPKANNKKSKKKPKYKTDWSRKTPTKKSNNSKDPRIPKFKVIKEVKPRKHQEYGTSQLEVDFARDYLDYLGLNYIYQYKAESIGRYFDFAITAYNGKTYIKEDRDGVMSVNPEKSLFSADLLIEVDGNYWHSHPDTVDESKLTPTQKRNKRVDKIKDEYAAMQCIPLLRIWESDIRGNRRKVLGDIQNYVKAANKKAKIKQNMKKPR